jgi:hypothetical protein
MADLMDTDDSSLLPYPFAAPTGLQADEQQPVRSPFLESAPLSQIENLQRESFQGPVYSSPLKYMSPSRLPPSPRPPSPFSRQLFAPTSLVDPDPEIAAMTCTSPMPWEVVALPLEAGLPAQSSSNCVDEQLQTPFPPPDQATADLLSNHLHATYCPMEESVRMSVAESSVVPVRQLPSPPQHPSCNPSCPNSSALRECQEYVTRLYSFNTAMVAYLCGQEHKYNTWFQQLAKTTETMLELTEKALEQCKLPPPIRHFLRFLYEFGFINYDGAAFAVPVMLHDGKPFDTVQVDTSPDTAIPENFAILVNIDVALMFYYHIYRQEHRDLLKASFGSVESYLHAGCCSFSKDIETCSMVTFVRAAKEILPMSYKRITDDASKAWLLLDPTRFLTIVSKLPPVCTADSMRIYIAFVAKSFEERFSESRYKHLHVTTKPLLKPNVKIPLRRGFWFPLTSERAKGTAKLTRLLVIADRRVRKQMETDVGFCETSLFLAYDSSAAQLMCATAAFPQAAEASDYYFLSANTLPYSSKLFSGQVSLR